MITYFSRAALLSLGILSFSAPAFAYKTEILQTGCGYSNFVYDEIVSRLGARQATRRYTPLAKYGESGRNFFIFSDGSWFLTFEIYSRTSDDVSCIVAKGAADAMDEATEREFARLPENRIGEFSDEAWQAANEQVFSPNRASRDRDQIRAFTAY